MEFTYLRACELSPQSIVDVDVHISILESLIHVETILSADDVTKLAVLSAEQNYGCLTAAACIVSASLKQVSETRK